MNDSLISHLPEASVEHCMQLNKNYTYKLDLSFNRKTKFGHYKFMPRTNAHIISINKGLSKPLFLITFLHELAHLEVMLTFGRKAKPHGKEWKQTFSSFLQPVLNELVFEYDLLKALLKHAISPKASLAADPVLWKELFPNSSTTNICVDDINIGELFSYKKRVFKKMKVRRTRVLCLEPASGHNFLIPRLAMVEEKIN